VLRAFVQWHLEVIVDDNGGRVGLDFDEDVAVLVGRHLEVLAIHFAHVGRHVPQA